MEYELAGACSWHPRLCRWPRYIEWLHYMSCHICQHFLETPRRSPRHVHCVGATVPLLIFTKHVNGSLMGTCLAQGPVRSTHAGLKRAALPAASTSTFVLTLHKMPRNIRRGQTLTESPYKPEMGILITVPKTRTPQNCIWDGNKAGSALTMTRPKSDAVSRSQAHSDWNASFGCS